MRRIFFDRPIPLYRTKEPTVPTYDDAIKYLEESGSGAFASAASFLKDAKDPLTAIRPRVPFEFTPHAGPTELVDGGALLARAYYVVQRELHAQSVFDAGLTRGQIEATAYRSMYRGIESRLAVGAQWLVVTGSVKHTWERRPYHDPFAPTPDTYRSAQHLTTTAQVVVISK